MFFELLFFLFLIFNSQTFDLSHVRISTDITVLQTFEEQAKLAKATKLLNDPNTKTQGEVLLEKCAKQDPPFLAAQHMYAQHLGSENKVMAQNLWLESSGHVGGWPESLYELGLKKERRGEPNEALNFFWRAATPRPFASGFVYRHPQAVLKIAEYHRDFHMQDALYWIDLAAKISGQDYWKNFAMSIHFKNFQSLDQEIIMKQQWAQKHFAEFQKHQKYFAQKEQKHQKYFAQKEQKRQEKEAAKCSEYDFECARIENIRSGDTSLLDCMECCFMLDDISALDMRSDMERKKQQAIDVLHNRLFDLAMMGDSVALKKLLEVAVANFDYGKITQLAQCASKMGNSVTFTRDEINIFLENQLKIKNDHFLYALATILENHARYADGEDDLEYYLSCIDKVYNKIPLTSRKKERLLRFNISCRDHKQLLLQVKEVWQKQDAAIIAMPLFADAISVLETYAETSSEINAFLADIFFEGFSDIFPVSFQKAFSCFERMSDPTIEQRLWCAEYLYGQDKKDESWQYLKKWKKITIDDSQLRERKMLLLQKLSLQNIQALIELVVSEELSIDEKKFKKWLSHISDENREQFLRSRAATIMYNYAVSSDNSEFLELFCKQITDILPNDTRMQKWRNELRTKQLEIASEGFGTFQTLMKSQKYVEAVRHIASMEKQEKIDGTVKKEMERMLEEVWTKSKDNAFLYETAKLFADDDSVFCDKQRSLEWLMNLSDNGYYQASFDLGHIYDAKQRYPEAASFYYAAYKQAPKKNKKGFRLKVEKELQKFLIVDSSCAKDTFCMTGCVEAAFYLFDIERNKNLSEACKNFLIGVSHGYNNKTEKTVMLLRQMNDHLKIIPFLEQQAEIPQYGLKALGIYWYVVNTWRDVHLNVENLCKAEKYLADYQKRYPNDDNMACNILARVQYYLAKECPEKKEHYLRISHQGGNNYATIDLARLLAKNEKTVDEAINLLWENGSDDCILCLGELFTKNTLVAEKMENRRAELTNKLFGLVKNKVYFATILLKRMGISLAVKYDDKDFEKLEALQSDREMNEKRSLAYELGFGAFIKKNYGQAIDLFGQAVDCGSWIAKPYLGVLHDIHCSDLESSMNNFQEYIRYTDDFRMMPCEIKCLRDYSLSCLTLLAKDKHFVPASKFLIEYHLNRFRSLHKMSHLRKASLRLVKMAEYHFEKNDELAIEWIIPIIDEYHAEQPKNSLTLSTVAYIYYLAHEHKIEQFKNVDQLYEKSLNLCMQAFECDDGLEKKGIIHLLKKFGLSFEKEGKTEDALDCYRKILKLNPQSIVAILFANLCFIKEGTEMEKKRAMQNGLAVLTQFAPKNPQAAYQLSNMYSGGSTKTGIPFPHKPKLAEKYFQMAVDGGYPEAVDIQLKKIKNTAMSNAVMNNILGNYTVGLDILSREELESDMDCLSLRLNICNNNFNGIPLDKTLSAFNGMVHCNYADAKPEHIISVNRMAEKLERYAMEKNDGLIFYMLAKHNLNLISADYIRFGSLKGSIDKIKRGAFFASCAIKSDDVYERSIAFGLLGCLQISDFLATKNVAMFTRSMESALAGLKESQTVYKETRDCVIEVFERVQDILNDVAKGNSIALRLDDIEVAKSLYGQLYEAVQKHGSLKDVPPFDFDLLIQK